METFPDRQAFLIVLAFAMGGLLGLCYDVIRPLRRRCGTLGKAFTDFIFSMSAASSLFTFSMGAGNGRLGLWELASALGGFLCYLYTMSDAVFAFLNREFAFFLAFGAKIGDVSLKAKNKTKNFFKKIVRCYIIKDRS